MAHLSEYTRINIDDRRKVSSVCKVDAYLSYLRMSSKHTALSELLNEMGLFRRSRRAKKPSAEQEAILNRIHNNIYVNTRGTSFQLKDIFDSALVVMRNTGTFASNVPKALQYIYIKNKVFIQSAHKADTGIAYLYTNSFEKGFSEYTNRLKDKKYAAEVAGAKQILDSMRAQPVKPKEVVDKYKAPAPISDVERRMPRWRRLGPDEIIGKTKRYTESKTITERGLAKVDISHKGGPAEAYYMVNVVGTRWVFPKLTEKTGSEKKVTTKVIGQGSFGVVKTQVGNNPTYVKKTYGAEYFSSPEGKKELDSILKFLALLFERAASDQDKGVYTGFLERICPVIPIDEKKGFMPYYPYPTCEQIKDNPSLAPAPDAEVIRKAYLKLRNDLILLLDLGLQPISENESDTKGVGVGFKEFHSGNFLYNTDTNEVVIIDLDSYTWSNGKGQLSNPGNVSKHKRDLLSQADEVFQHICSSTNRAHGTDKNDNNAKGQRLDFITDIRGSRDVDLESDGHL